MTAFSTPLDIANRALQHCGVTRIRSSGWLPNSPNEDSKQSSEVAFVYDKVRQAELRRNCWRFATRRAVLRPMTNQTMLLNPPVFDPTVTYGTGSIVADSNNVLWSSNSAVNTGNTPGSSRAWSLYFGPLAVNPFQPTPTSSTPGPLPPAVPVGAYEAGELVYTTDNQGNFQVWVSIVGNNTDTPSVPDNYESGCSYNLGDVVVYPVEGTTSNPLTFTMADLTALLPYLSTTLPATAGIPWNDGGVLAWS